jgi:hypothetical protein
MKIARQDVANQKRGIIKAWFAMKQKDGAEFTKRLSKRRIGRQLVRDFLEDICSGEKIDVLTRNNDIIKNTDVEKLFDVSEYKKTTASRKENIERKLSCDYFIPVLRSFRN